MKLIGFLIVISFASCGHDKTFNSALWINAPQKDVNIRNEMVDDLVSRKLLNNLNDREIIKLLGKSEQYQNISPRKFYYTVQIKYKMIDPEYIKYFVVELDDNNKFNNFRIIEHK
jgi:hypothetical protein